jgi:hypothetical protein
MDMEDTRTTQQLRLCSRIILHFAGFSFQVFTGVWHPNVVVLDTFVEATPMQHLHAPACTHMIHALDAP